MEELRSLGTACSAPAADTAAYAVPPPHAFSPFPISPPLLSSPASPPTTPPTMAPTFVDEELVSSGAGDCPGLGEGGTGEPPGCPPPAAMPDVLTSTGTAELLNEPWPSSPTVKSAVAAPGQGRQGQVYTLS